MAVTWNISDTSGLGSNYKDTVKSVANNHGYGSLYYAERIKDDAPYHRFIVRTKKLLGLSKYQFIVLTHYDEIWKTEEGSGCSPTVTKL
jgi:hypothetical protein